MLSVLDDLACGIGTHSEHTRNTLGTQVLRDVTGLQDLTEKDLEEWRDRFRV
jgi:hypothetical protein